MASLYIAQDLLKERILSRIIFVVWNIEILYRNFRSSHQWCFIKKAVLQNLFNIQRKTPVLESLFNKVAGLQPCNFIKNRLQHRCFFVNIANFFKTPILKNVCERLLLELLSMAASVRECLRSRILESLPKISKILALMKHYKKIYVMKYFLRKVLQP